MQVSQSYQKLGNFTASYSKLSLNKILKSVSKYFINDTWDLGDRKFQDSHAKQFFSCASIINGLILWIDYNKNPSIIKQISGPKFVSLTTVYLGDNNITSLEALAFLDMPELKQIALNDNLISNLAALSKCSFKKLQYVSLNGNRVFCLEPLKRFTLQKLDKLKILDQLCPFKAWQNINVLWMMKTQMVKETAEIFFDQKLTITPELCLIKLKLRRKNYAHPCSTGNDNSSSCSPLPPTQ